MRSRLLFGSVLLTLGCGAATAPSTDNEGGAEGGAQQTNNSGNDSAGGAANTGSAAQVDTVEQQGGNPIDRTTLPPPQEVPVAEAPAKEPDAVGCEEGFVSLSNGSDGLNIEQVCFSETALDRQLSLAAFEEFVYPVLRSNCSGCHSSGGQSQAPMHADLDPVLAHEYALTRVNFRQPADSKLVVRMATDRHNCFGTSCTEAAATILEAVENWANVVAPTLRKIPRGVTADTTVGDAEVLAWLDADRATVAEADAPYVRYVSLHELHNAGATAEQLDVARVAVGKALNSVARWAPEIRTPEDVTGHGILYRFDTRWYWGYNKGVERLHFGGSDDDILFGNTPTNYKGEEMSSTVMWEERYDYSATVQQDAGFADLVWERIVAGNVEGATDSGSLPANTNGFRGDFIEASQLVYTLTRPDVYNSIMAIPWMADQLEAELGVITDEGADSYQYMVTKQAIGVDSRMYWRARTSSGGYYWKTWDVFTGQLPEGVSTIEQAYSEGYVRFPFWSNPIPKFISPTGFGEENFSFVATLAQSDTNSAECDGQESYADPEAFNCRYYTGEGGLQQSAEEVIFTLPNGLQGYALFGAINQRRVDAFNNIVRDPRLLPTVGDEAMNSQLGFLYTTDYRLNVGSSCIGCHADGLNRGTNDLRDWLDNSQAQLPHGEHGVDGWIDNETTVARVRELYPPSSVMRPRMEQDRRPFLGSMAQIKANMMFGPDRNLYVEPVTWTIEWARTFYQYEITRSN